METDDVVFKLRLKFDICCMASEERRVPQTQEDSSLLYHRSMYIYISHSIGLLSDLWYGIRSG